MAWQLIYTSAPRGLVPGRSGFCTVARHREIRDGLVTEIERFSQYDRSGRGSGAQSPVVYAHRIVRLGGSSYHVLSCTRDAGADYTGRTNHLAHHLICEPHELANAPSPPEVLRQMAWCRTWADAPRYLGAEEAINLHLFDRTARLPAQTWQALTSDAGCAALPLESGALSGCYWLYPAEAGEQYLLPLFAESLLLLDPSGRKADKLWQVPFTTYLQSTDHAADFFWRGCWQGSSAALTAQNARQTLDLTRSLNLRPPENQAAELARTGLPASPETSEATPVGAKALSETWHHPEPRADSGGQELDLAELLASADNVRTRKGARTNSGGREGARPRKLPIKLLVALGTTLAVIGALAIGFLVWRNGKAEQIREELTSARIGGDFATGPARVPTIWGILRSYEPLKIEIERTQVAAELDALKSKTPDEVRAYRTLNRERLAIPAIRDDFQIILRMEKIQLWLDADERLSDLSDLNGRIAAASFREPATRDGFKREFDEEIKAINALDVPYRPTVMNRLKETKRAYVSCWLAKLRKADKSESMRENFVGEVNQLRKDAEAFELDDLVKRIAEIDARRQQAGRKSDAPENPPAAAPVVPPDAKGTKDAHGLTDMATYIATDSGTGFNVSGVEEMQGLDVIPAVGTWLLFRTPEPPLNPQNATQEKCSIINGKIYYGNTAELVTLQQPQLVMSPTAREALRKSFLLRFTPTPEASTTKGFQILFLQGDQAPQRFPTDSSLTYDPKRATITLSAEVVATLSRIKLAAAAAPELVFRAEGWGERAGIPIPLGEAGAAVPLSLSPIITKVEGEARKSSSQPSLVESKADRVRAAKEARDLLMSTGNPTGELQSVLRDVKNGRAYMDFTSQLFIELGKVIDDQLRKANNELTNERLALANTKKENKGRIEQIDQKIADLNNKIADLEKQKSALKPILKSFESELNIQGLSELRCKKVINIWTDAMSSPLARLNSDPAKTFCEKWLKLFTPEYIDKIRPFLKWNLPASNDGDLDQAFAALPDKKTPAESVEDKGATLLGKLQSDFMSLAPFSIALKTADGNAIPLVNFIDAPRVDGAKPVKTDK